MLAMTCCLQHGLDRSAFHRCMARPCSSRLSLRRMLSESGILPEIYPGFPASRPALTAAGALLLHTADSANACCLGS